jgi:hypothetical protein
MFRFSLRALLTVLCIGPFLLATLWINRAFLVTVGGHFLIGCAYACVMAAMISVTAAILACVERWQSG